MPALKPVVEATLDGQINGDETGPPRLALEPARSTRGAFRRVQ
jgi:hypothetical protein